MHSIINDVDTASLEQAMASIDWASIVNPGTSEMQITEGNNNWVIETLIESVVEDLHKLEEDEAGNRIALKLKQKYWGRLPFLEQIGDIKFSGNKQEVSQRFYFYSGQTGISIDEAYRFLQNMLFEKQLQLTKKQSRINSDTIEDKVKRQPSRKAAAKRNPVNRITEKVN